MPRLLINLDDATFAAIAALALEERRRPQAQAAWMLCQTFKARLAQDKALRHLESSASAEEGAC